MSNIRELSQLASVIVVDNSTKYVGIGSTLPGSKLSVGGDAYISGNTRVVGILSVGSGTITIDGDNGIIGVGTVTLTETQVSQLDDLTGEDGNFSGNVSVAGTVTAIAYYGDGSTLDNIVSDVVEDTSPQLGGNLDLNGNDITGTGNIDITGNITLDGNVTIGGTLTYEDVTNIDSIGIITARKGIIVSSGYGISSPNIVATAVTFGGVTYPTSDGSQNQVLATDGSGTLQFLSVSSLSGFDWESDQDLGLITDSVTESVDIGGTGDAVSNIYNLGTIATGGVIYPDTFVLPSYTVSTLPSANPAGGMLFVTDETGGSVPAFSDGTNWRRVTDRQIVS